MAVREPGGPVSNSFPEKPGYTQHRLVRYITSIRTTTTGKQIFKKLIVKLTCPNYVRD